MEKLKIVITAKSLYSTDTFECISNDDSIYIGDTVLIYSSNGIFSIEGTVVNYDFKYIDKKAYPHYRVRKLATVEKYVLTVKSTLTSYTFECISDNEEICIGDIVDVYDSISSFEAKVIDCEYRSVIKKTLNDYMKARKPKYKHRKSLNYEDNSLSYYERVEKLLGKPHEILYNSRSHDNDLNDKDVEFYKFAEVALPDYDDYTDLFLCDGDDIVSGDSVRVSTLAGSTDGRVLRVLNIMRIDLDGPLNSYHRILYKLSDNHNPTARQIGQAQYEEDLSYKKASAQVLTTKQRELARAAEIQKEEFRKMQEETKRKLEALEKSIKESEVQRQREIAEIARLYEMKRKFHFPTPDEIIENPELMGDSRVLWPEDPDDQYKAWYDPRYFMLSVNAFNSSNKKDNK